MLKCGQRDNKKYTFGIRQELDIDRKNVDNLSILKKFCSACGTKLANNADYCFKCGSPI